MRMIRKSSSVSRYRLLTTVVCCVIFLCFSFAYLYVMQGELMRCLCRDWLGMTAYSPFWGALVITLCLWSVQWLLGKVVRMGDAWLALSYFPAYWALAFLTCVYPIEAGGDFPLGWKELWWLFPVALLLYLVAVFVCWHSRRGVDGRKKSGAGVLIPNLIILILFSCITGSVGNSNELLHNELLIAKYIREQRYEEALLVGKKSLHNTHSLTALRVMALSYTGALGESLFEYPQSDKSNGLFFQEDRDDVCAFTNKDIEQSLGGVSRQTNESPTCYLQRICETDSVVSLVAIDYYLCALLLDKQLSAFHQALLRYWPTEKALPRHYQEALLVYQQQAGDVSSLLPMCTPSVKERYDAFLQLQAQYELPLYQNNYARRKFGDTYWWYYWYGE